jgi:tRNA-splicing ligase RtcB
MHNLRKIYIFYILLKFMLKQRLKKIREGVYELSKGSKPGMKVPALLFLSEKLLKDVETGAVEQAANVAFLPGIYKHSIALPDMHFGYGFPIGGVAALDYENGGLSPGGIGFDINCGVRVLRTNLREEQVKPKMRELLETIFRNVPSGVGSKGRVKLSWSQLEDVVEIGAKWAVENGYGRNEDLEHLEEKGSLPGKAESISEKAMKRGMPQLGSLGAGNHFLEIQKVEKIFSPKVAEAMGIEEEGQVAVMIHTGSRGFGHQVCTDYLRILEGRFREIKERLPDRELIYAPAKTKECDSYFHAMNSAANYAWCNRQMITHWVRESIAKALRMNEEEIGLDVIYDVAHNIGKVEEHKINGKAKKVYVHRKGATRAFGPGSTDIPKDYKKIGQPVLIPGSMGTASYILIGTRMAEEETFSSVCHGAGRLKSRAKAIKTYRGEQVKRALEGEGILVRSASWKVLAEEAPDVYKDVDEVVRTCEIAGITKAIVKLRPLGVVKG